MNNRPITDEELKALSDDLRQLLKSHYLDYSDDDSIEVAEEVEEPWKSSFQRDLIETCFKKVFIFRNISEDELLEIGAYFKEKVVEPGEVVQGPNLDNNAFYCVEEGKLEEISKRGNVRRKYRAGSHFGEQQLMYGFPLKTTIRATLKTKLWYLPQKPYARFVVNLRQRKMQLYKTLLDGVPFLKEHFGERLKDMASLVMEQDYKKDTEIVTQGKVQNGLYILVSGQLKFEQEIPGHPLKTWEEDEPGTFFGVDSLTGKLNWKYTVHAIEKCYILYLSKEEFEGSYALLLGSAFKQDQL